MLFALIRRLWKADARGGARYARNIPDADRVRDAVMLQQRGEWNDALEIYRKLLDEAPGNSQVLHLMASALAGAGRNAEAIACYRRMLSAGATPDATADASYPEARLAFAGLLNADGDFNEAAAQARAALGALANDPAKSRMAELARDELRKAAIMNDAYPARRSFRRAAAAMPVPDAVNIVYFHVAAKQSPNATCVGIDYPELIALSAATARRRMPGARIVLLTDETSQFPGLRADRVIRRAAAADEVVFERMRMQRAYVASDAFDADSILVDSDTVFHGDARSAFASEFDLAYTVRRGFELMPFNVGVVFMRHASRASLLQYLDSCLDCFSHLERNPAVAERYQEGIRRWWGDQLVPAAMVGWQHCAREILQQGCDVAEIAGTRLGFLPAAIYNHDAETELGDNAALAGKLVLHFKGRRKEGMRHYVASLDLPANGADARQAWKSGLAALDAGDLAQARTRLEQAVALAPGEAAWKNELGLLCMALHDNAAAAAMFRAALAVAPGLAEAHCNLGIVLQQQAAAGHAEDAEPALPHFQRAAELKPELAAAQYNCGLLLWQMARPDDALPFLDRALARDAGLADAWRYRGHALQDLRRFDEAHASFERSLAIKPDYHEVRLSLAFLHLLRGEFRAGWRDYAARYATAESPLRDYPCADWDGAPLTGKTLLVYAEQGLGDEILFASCLPDLIAQARHVVIDCEPRLEKLFARSFPQATVHGVARNAPAQLPDAAALPDCKIAAGSVPGFLRNEWSDFPPSDHYLRADPARVAHWKQRLDALGPGPKIGIAWRGGLPQTRAALRSLELPGLLPILRIPGMRFISLQHGDTAAARDALARSHGIRVEHWQEAHADYDETAALMMALDAVVTVCCSIVHLAGALGKPALVLTPYVPEWRYLAEGDAMPWYRSVRLIRQTRRADWSDVLERAREALELLSDRAPAARNAGDGSSRRQLEQRVRDVPEDAAAYRALAEIALSDGDTETAIDNFELALHYRADDATAMLGLARALRTNGRAAEAEAQSRNAAALAPSLAATLELAAALKAQERYAESIAEYRAALAAHGRDPALLCNFGHALYLAGDYDEAQKALRDALALDADFAEARHNLGLVLRELGAIEAALGEFQRALSLRDHPATRSAMAHALRDLGRFDEALAEYDVVLAADPANGDALLNRAHALLMRGDYAPGWDAYERRFAAGRYAPRSFALRQWEGGPGAGKGILVFGEQGLGDEIMFASCIPDLIARESGCVIECNARLAPLFARSFAAPVHGGSKQDDTGWIQAHRELGWQSPVGSLPRIFRRDASSFAHAKAGFLRADKARVAEWKNKFADIESAAQGTAGQARRIGLSWRGGNPRTRGVLRSIDLKALTAIFAAPDCQFISLQHGDVAQEIADCAGAVRIASWPQTGDELDELAAMIAALDLVITIDNTVAHLAGALGKPVWILLARGAEWRYGTDPERVPWYPNARLFRQTGATVNWGEVVDRVASALAHSQSAMNSSQDAMQRGTDAARAGRHREAIAHFGRALEIVPEFAAAHREMARSQLELGEYEAAADSLQMAGHYAPDDAWTRFLQGLLAQRRDEIDVASAYYRRAIELDPGFAEAHNNLGYMLVGELDRIEEGITHLQAALRARPGYLDALLNLGLADLYGGKREKAIAAFDSILARDPSCDEARLNRAIARLALGRWELAWDDYEARKRVATHWIPRPFAFPEWDGAAAPGRSVLVYAEQGLGDEIMFASCIPQVMEQVGSCVIECSTKLAPLFARSFPAATVHGGGQRDATDWVKSVPAIDMQIAMGSLPRLFRRTRAEFPEHHGYLAADPAKAAAWRKKLDALGPRPKIALSWRGGMRQTRQTRRSIPVQQLAQALSGLGADFVSLQYDRADNDVDIFMAAGVNIQHWPAAIADYDETAALVSEVDLVVSVCTALIHLGGALGRPVWVLAPAHAEWRYGESGEELPWYPSVRVLRQETPGAWAPLLAHLRSELEMHFRGET